MGERQGQRRGAAKAARKLNPRAPSIPATPEPAAWYADKSFSVDWTSWHFPNWIKLLAPLRKRKLRVLEIGSWEGRSALFFLNYLPHATVTCIDTFAGGQEHREAAAANYADARTLRDIEKRFDRNTFAFRTRIEKIKAASSDALIALGLENRRFDLAYIDGGHRSSEVYADAVLTWPLMVQGGRMMFDDYAWREMPERLDNPGPGVDAFLIAFAGQYRELVRDYQVVIEKARAGPRL